MSRRLIAAAALAIVAVAAPSAAQQAQRDWTRQVAATAEGGFRMGNPDAPLKLVEYGSLTCDHCATFAREGMPGLMPLVRSGRLSFEFRNFVRDPVDLTAAALSRCAGPAQFFPLTDRLFASQGQWLGRYQAMTDAQASALSELAPGARMARLAAIGGLDAAAAGHGLPAAKAQACLADEAGLKRLAEMRRVASEKHQIQGTPSFLLNGRTLTDVHHWGALQPLLKQPPGG